MRGEFIGVWSETWREIWQPLIDQPLGENDEGLREDIFCELYRELAKALRKPTGSAAVDLLLRDAVALREAFEGAAQRAGRELAFEQVKEAFEQSGVEGAATDEQRRALVEAALSGLLAQPGVPLLNAQLQEHAHDVGKVASAWERVVEETINDAQASRQAFENTTATHLPGERALVGFFESVHTTLAEFENAGDDELTNRYFNLLAAFIEKFSLRYDLRRPCVLCPTLAGVFSSLVRDLRALASRDSHLDGLMKDFEEAIRDLRTDCSDSRIRHCIQREVILLEALGQSSAGVTEDTLGAICNQLQTWPHDKVLEAVKNLYKFTNNYPGIRHAGESTSARRAIDMRDLVAVSIVFAGFTPYLSDLLNPDVVYRGT